MGGGEIGGGYESSRYIYAKSSMPRLIVVLTTPIVTAATNQPVQVSTTPLMNTSTKTVSLTCTPARFVAVSPATSMVE
jgi:hypothetical protein